MSRADGIRRARLDKNYSQDDLAKLIGVSRVAVSNWERDDSIKLEAHNAYGLEKHLGLDAKALTQGLATPATGMHGRVSISLRRLPIVGLAEAGRSKLVIRENERGYSASVDVDEELATTLGPQSFAVRVADISNSPEFRIGDLVLVDPDLVPAPGDMVVALFDPGAPAVIRKYRDRGHMRYELAPTNNDFGSISVEPGDPARIIGVVVEHRRRLKN